MSIFSIIFIRTQIIIFWLIIISLFLFFPSVKFWESPKSITIMTWADLIDQDLIEQFEAETGIKVHQSYFESNEELYVRFKATEGKGHDLIVPSDFMVKNLIEDDLLRPIDRSKLTFWSRLDTRLLHLYYDPASNYSIPFYWALYGIGYNKNEFNFKLPATWKIIFDCSLGKYVVMPETAREVVSLAIFYLFGSLDNLNEEKFKQVKELLLQQKKCVGAYSETRADYLLSVQEFSLAVIPTAIFWRTLKQHAYLEFMIPQEGMFAIIDNFVIPKYAKNEDLVYKFLNFLYRPENIRHTFENRRFFPATTELIPLLQEYDAAPSIIEAHKTDPTFWQFFKRIPQQELVEETWVAIKAE